MKRVSVLNIIFLITFSFSAFSHDWPMWRYDYNRSASSPEQLADNLHLQWQANYNARQPVWDDPLNQNLMKFDRLFEPVVAGNMLFIGFNDQDKISALDLNTGEIAWDFYTDGPVRLPLAVNQGNIYFTGDDGFIYCVNASSGKLVWKRLLAPASNKLLGNKRLISMWPARGGVVIKNNVVYAAASIFPLMGTFIYALDANTGNVIWKNEGTGSNYILQPHNSPAFAHVAPQGAFTISGNKLLVAGGRSVPAAFDLETGQELYYHLAASGKTGGAFVCANNKVFFNHHRERETTMYHTETGIKLAPEIGEYPAIQGDTIYFPGKKIMAMLLQGDNKLDTLCTIDFSATNDLIKAGNFLYAADSTGIKAIKLLPDNGAELTWTFKTNKNIERLVAANEKLIAVTTDGTIMVFGENQVEAVTVHNRVHEPRDPQQPKSGIIRDAANIEGYCLVLGGDNKAQLEDLVYGTTLNVVVYEKDLNQVQQLREYFDAAGVSANRLSFQHFENSFPALPNYFSSLTIVNDAACLENGQPEVFEKLYETTRPYGGRIVFPGNRKENNGLFEKMVALNLPGAKIQKNKDLTIVVREGSLPGASPWTHNYGDIANTVKSDDRLVKAPLGIL